MPSVPKHDENRVVSGHRPEMKPDGEPLSSGYISLQAESHPIQFRKVEIKELKD